MSKKTNTLFINLILILLVVLISIIPLFITPYAEFGGTDYEAELAITELQSDYEPWFEPLFEPPSGEIESLIFALQAAFGASVLSFGFGYLKGRSHRKVNSSHETY